MLDKNIHFENKVLKDLVDADQESLKIILRNLLDNAIKFSSQDGAIKLYSKMWILTFVILLLKIADWEWMNPHRTSERNSCFQEENEDIVGTGLGLQLCKSMIKKNGGNSGLRANWERDKMIVSLPKTQKNG
jgi:signal transduction histidine kinase